MTGEGKDKTVTVVMSCFFLIFFGICLLKKADAESFSERRSLQQLPQLTVKSIGSGAFMSDFEEYALDQFPARDSFRTLKTLFSFYVLGQRDNHGIYVLKEHAGKIEYPMREEMLVRALDRFRYVYDRYLADTQTRLYLSVIPDKHFFLAGENGYPSMDYDAFYGLIKESTDYMEYVDITSLLSLNDYYRTDLHWKQEELTGVADRLAAAMGTKLQGEYEVKCLDIPFYGVYYGQAALPMEPDEIKYLTNEVLRQCEVYDFQNDKLMAVYDMEKAYGRDSYEMFLSGSLPLLEIRNPSADTDKELIIFRDSFASSLAPLLAQGYAKLTLVDIRYIHPDILSRYLEFENQDVLFLYSVTVLNHGETIK